MLSVRRVDEWRDVLPRVVVCASAPCPVRAPHTPYMHTYAHTYIRRYPRHHYPRHDPHVLSSEAVGIGRRRAVENLLSHSIFHWD